MKRSLDKFSVLAKDICQDIFDKAVDVLINKGMMVHSEKLRQLMLQNGCKLGDDGKVVFLTKDIIGKAIETVPSEFELFDLNGNGKKVAQGTILDWVMPYIESLETLRYGKETLEPSTLEDLRQALIVSESIDIVSLNGIITWPLEIDPKEQLNYALYESLTTTRKTLIFGLQNVEFAKKVANAVKIATKDVNLAGKRHVIFVSSPTSPLVLDADSGDTLIYGIEQGFVPLIAACPMAGATSQFSVIGTVLQQAIEELFMLCAKYSINPECSVIWGGAGAPMDMRIGDVSYGSIERSLIMLGNIDMAKFIGLPCHSPSSSIDSCLLDVQHGAEKTWTYLTRVLSDAAIGMAIGSVTNGTAISLEQLVIDTDMIKAICNFADGIEVDNLDNAYEEIKAVDHGGNFMMAEQTMALLTKGGEYYYPETFNHSGTNGLTAEERAHKKIEKYLADWKSPVSDEIAKQLKEFLF